MNAHSSLPPPSPTPVFEGGNEISKKLRRGEQIKKKSVWETKRGKVEEIQRS